MVCVENFEIKTKKKKKRRTGKGEALKQPTKYIRVITISLPLSVSSFSSLSSICIGVATTFMCDPSAVNRDTALHYVAALGLMRHCRLLLQKSTKVNVADVYNRTALHYATARGHAEVAMLLLNCGE